MRSLIRKTVVRSGMIVALGCAMALLTAVRVQADPVGGAKYKVDTVSPYTTDQYTVRLFGGEDTLISLSGDGSTCLELRVYNAYGSLVACDTIGTGDYRVVVFRPRSTGTFTVAVRNIGCYYNSYRLVIE